ncbi:serine/threonine-protein kinase [Geodermatophilus ruber]|uniref:non-specific serine/threonine protein kinase n=1 Tax=Geodermatophilus ruber TaxID=504800 RepID=A0A1I4DB20_9ACTN|nr:serine/threonine-protein kinase [Geodermatophilus ruber]SFK91004.1 Serine/threonine protein kinase [Geodermatophilus ruber]
MIGPDFLVAERYRLLSRIGGGGMGAVWLARDERLGRQVAVKQVLPPVDADPATVDRQRQRALREGRIAARLSHPHAVSVYDVAVEGDAPWLVMEYLPSRSLAEVLQEDGVLRVDQVAQIGAQLADALDAAHGAGIVHRDVKPANVLIGQGRGVDGLVKITDFGISHASGDVTLTQTGQITGTPAFLAPEVAQGAAMSPASDVFSLGATLYTCLEGAPPFGMDENALRLLHRVAAGEPTPPRRAGALTGPLTRMLAADPAHRPSMSEVRDELAALAAGRDGDTTTVLLARTDLRTAATQPRTSELPPPEQPAAGPLPDPSGRVAGESSVRSRRRSPLLLSAAVLAVLLVALGVLWFTSRQEAPSGAAAPAPTTAPDTADPSAPPETTPPAEEEQPTASSPPPETTASPSPAEAGEVRGREVRDALRDYHALLPGDPDAAWELTGPTLRNAVSRGGYEGFWSQFDDVKVSEIRAEDGSLVATAVLDFRYPDGSRQRERHEFSLVPGEDGGLLVDADRVLEVLESR